MAGGRGQERVRRNPPEKLDFTKLKGGWSGSSDSSGIGALRNLARKTSSSDKCPYLYHGERDRTHIQSVYTHDWQRKEVCQGYREIRRAFRTEEKCHSRASMYPSPRSKRRRNRECFLRNLYELAKHCEFLTNRSRKRFKWNRISILTQMARQSELVKFQVASQSDGKHLGEVQQKKDKANPARILARNVRNKNPKLNISTVQPCSRCNRVHKQDETCPASGRRCSKCHKRAILLLFAVL